MSRNPRSCSNKNIEIRIASRIKPDIKVQSDRPELFVYEKKEKGKYQ